MILCQRVSSLFVLLTIRGIKRSRYDAPYAKRFFYIYGRMDTDKDRMFRSVDLARVLHAVAATARNASRQSDNALTSICTQDKRE
jgi:hypothetical protein